MLKKECIATVTLNQHWHEPLNHWDWLPLPTRRAVGDLVLEYCPKAVTCSSHLIEIKADSVASWYVSIELGMA